MSKQHQRWMSMMQPEGLVVSGQALDAAKVFLPEQKVITDARKKLWGLLDGQTRTSLSDFAAMTRDVLEWPAEFLVRDDLRGKTVLDGLQQNIVEQKTAQSTPNSYTIRPDFAVVKNKKRERGAQRAAQRAAQHTATERAAQNKNASDVTLTEKPSDTYLALGMTLSLQDDLAAQEAARERLVTLLHRHGIEIGLIAHPQWLRLVVYHSEKSHSSLLWRYADLVKPSASLMLGALLMLLGKPRLFTAAHAEWLPTILAESRKYQGTVSTQLSRQVLLGLQELLQGFHEADVHAQKQQQGSLLRDQEDGALVYAGLLSTMLRLVFILFAEERGLLGDGELYSKSYSLLGLYEKLSLDEGQYPDNMDQRYGAWPRLLALFRMIYQGCAPLSLPPRLGHLFDPDAWPFLEGRRRKETAIAARLIPKISDGVVLRILRNLLLLDGEKLSYRALDVEHLGAIYENMMGFTLQRAQGTSIGLGNNHAVLNLETLLTLKADKRLEYIRDETDEDLPKQASNLLKAADSIDGILASLHSRLSYLYVDMHGRPRSIKKDVWYIAPTEERRRTGSHYTPPELARPVVAKTLRPIWERLGWDGKSVETAPAPEAILQLKICDPAMGSGAFLVAACHTLGTALVSAYQRHGFPADLGTHDVTLYANRQIAQHCLYGVDKNPTAVELAKLSLWLSTLSKDQPFVFVDHALRCGDSLVGASLDMLKRFHWSSEEAEKENKSKRGKTGKSDATDDGFDLQLALLQTDRQTETAVNAVLEKRRLLLSNNDDTHDIFEKTRVYKDVEQASLRIKRIGDHLLDAFFRGEKEKDRKEYRSDALKRILSYLKGDQEIPEVKDAKVQPFHWELEFPEVFARENGGFDAFVGNPPFLGGKRISTMYGDAFRDWLAAAYDESNSNSDLVSYFFRRAFAALRQNGTLGFVATNTLAQGDTRSTGLRYILKHGGTIYDATTRYVWPGLAAVVVSLVHIAKGQVGSILLNDKPVSRISAFLSVGNTDDNPVVLRGNESQSFQGCILRGMGFTFDDNTIEATPIEIMRQLIAKDPRNQERIFPYIGGEEVNTSPTHAHHRYTINFVDASEESARNWPDLMQIIEAKVRPAREVLSNSSVDRAHKEKWWLFANSRPEMMKTIKNLDRVLVCSLVSKWLCSAFLPSHYVFSHKLAVFAFSQYTASAIMQSRIHEIFALFFSSTMKDDINYSPTDCFETFPFPPSWEENAELEEIGKTYYEFRADLMIRTNQGLTKTYNDFHDENCYTPDISKLRDLHDAMDRAVIKAYGWTDILDGSAGISLDCDFYPEHEDDPKSKKRYRWSNDTRDVILARLLELNQHRAQAEKTTIPEPITKAKTKTASSKTSTTKTPSNPTDAAQNNLLDVSSSSAAQIPTQTPAPPPLVLEAQTPKPRRTKKGG